MPVTKEILDEIALSPAEYQLILDRLDREPNLPEASKAGGAILSDQLKSLDWRARRAVRFDRASEDVIREVTARLLPLVDPE